MARNIQVVRRLPAITMNDDDERQAWRLWETRVTTQRSTVVRVPVAGRDTHGDLTVVEGFDLASAVALGILYEGLYHRPPPLDRDEVHGRFRMVSNPSEYGVKLPGKEDDSGVVYPVAYRVVPGMRAFHCVSLLIPPRMGHPRFRERACLHTWCGTPDTVVVPADQDLGLHPLFPLNAENWSALVQSVRKRLPNDEPWRSLPNHTWELVRDEDMAERQMRECAVCLERKKLVLFANGCCHRAVCRGCARRMREHNIVFPVVKCPI